jgi:glycerol-3-phosphate dehydrogenase
MRRYGFDVVILGAGIIGSTIARELTRYDLRVAVLDRAADIPSGASRANSSMIHAGFDDKPGTVKARFCSAGNRLYRGLAEELDFRLVPCGSYVCAFDEEQERHLETLRSQGERNGVPGMEIIAGEELRRREPHASGAITRALWAPSGAIVNNFEAVLAFIDNAQNNGAELFLETEVQDLLLLEGRGEILGVRTNRGDFLAPIVINAAGVHSDRIARMAGDDSFAIRPTRGEYFIFDKAVGHLVKGFFFACPSKAGKGITVACTAENNLLIGPTSTPQTSRDDTSTTGEGLEETILGAKRLIPDIPMGMAITTFSGLRANTLDGDFHIGALPRPRGFVNVAGIKSPGFTSAPAIALHVVEMIREELGDRVEFRPNPGFVPVRKHIPRFAELPMEERARLAREDGRYGQIVCRCETVTEAQVVEAIRRGARTVAGVKIWTRAGGGRCQGGFCGPRVAEILSRELGIPLDEVTRHGGHSRLLVGRTKEYWFRGERG